MSEVAPEQARAAVEWQAEEAARARTVEAKVAALNEPAPAPALTPEQQEQAAQAAQLAAVVETQLPKLCTVAWGLVDRLVQQFAGPELALKPEELRQLAEATVPVVNKYMPKGMDWLTTTPEGALALTAGMIYGFKVLASEQKQPEPVAAGLSTPEGATA